MDLLRKQRGVYISGARHYGSSKREIWGCTVERLDLTMTMSVFVEYAMICTMAVEITLLDLLSSDYA